jgi:hypothetical protein
VRGNPHAAFDVAGAGNVAWSRWCDTRKRKGEPTGNTNIDLRRGAVADDAGHEVGVSSAVRTDALPGVSTIGEFVPATKRADAPG